MRRRGTGKGFRLKFVFLSKGGDAFENADHAKTTSWFGISVCKTVCIFT
jgi:hypothetical protein